MNSLETEAEIAADGTIQLLSPLPAWLKPGRRHLVLAVTEDAAVAADPHALHRSSPEVLARRLAALNGLKAAGGLGKVIGDAASWQRDIREDTTLPGRE